MEDTSVPSRRFGPEFVEEYRRRHGNKPPQGRTLTYENAVNEEFAPRRDWLDEQLRQLSVRQADRLARCVWKDEHYWSVHFEMAVGAALRQAGLHIVYDYFWGRQTPDWTVMSDTGEPLCLVEVYTASPPQKTYDSMRAWHQLTQQIKTIPVGVVLRLEPTGRPVQAPDSRTAKRIAGEIRGALCGALCPSRISTSFGYTFLVQGDRYGGVIPSPFGLFACFDPPSSTAGQVSAAQIIQPVKDKISKYRRIVDEHDLPLVVAVGAHRFTGLGLRELDDLLTGEPVLTFQFNLGDTHVDDAIFPPPRWDMPRELSGLLWVDNKFPFAVTSRPNPAAHRPMPATLASLGA
ncbi:hypothetical protein [Streptosporangium saharense]|uniref:Uncharacterized protein n=1 Tax=Streptosporangium saharense TaxID=1706840 RepID=A0A7W7QGS5_9ACTN|nr:hypothetical protein [Streptosporangium saharense]MBB4913352.1 hypothetical protein [Streptosporangium saharense]